MMRKIEIASLTLAMTVFLLTNTCYAANPLDKAWEHFYDENYKKAIKVAERITNEQGHYVMGLCYLKLGKPSHARTHFEFILDMYSNTGLRQELELSVADSYFLDGDFAAAVSKYSAFTRKYPRSALNSLAYLKLGQSQRRLGRWQEAKISLSKIIKAYPNSFEKASAQAELAKEFYYFIQVASFRKRTNATKNYTNLKKKGFDAYISNIMKDRKAFYRVCIGNYKNKSNAITILAKLKIHGYKGRIYP